MSVFYLFQNLLCKLITLYLNFFQPSLPRTNDYVSSLLQKLIANQEIMIFVKDRFGMSSIIITTCESESKYDTLNQVNRILYLNTVNVLENELIWHLPRAKSTEFKFINVHNVICTDNFRFQNFSSGNWDRNGAQIISDHKTN